MPPLALLSLLGAAALAGVSSMPMEKDHVEEMVTRCIVEVLSTALSKPNAPPINPLCKDILKKSSRYNKAEKKNENEEQLEVRHLQEPSEDENHQQVSVEEERGRKEESEAEKHLHEEDESRSEENKYNGDSHFHETRIHNRGKKHHMDIRGEEEEDDDENSYKRNNHSEEGSKEKGHYAEDSEAEHELPDKRSHSKSMEEFSPGDDKPSAGHRHSEEKMHSNEKRHHESDEDEEQEVQEEEEEESSERYHHESKEHSSYQYRDHEASEENEEEEKRRYKPKHYHRKHRVGDSSKERQDHDSEKRNPLEEPNDEDRFWDKKSHDQKRHYKEPEHHLEEKRSYGEHSSEEFEEKRHTGHGSEEYREQRHQNKNSGEEGQRHHTGGESEEDRHEKKRYHDEPREAGRHHYEKKHHSEESEEDLDKHHDHSNRDEKRHHGEGRHHLHDREDEETHKLHSGESKGQSMSHYSAEEWDGEEKRYYPGYEGDEEIEKRHYSENQKQDNEASMEKVRYGEEYNSNFPADNAKRAAIRYGPLYHHLQWKSRNVDKKDNMGEQILESEQESKPSLNEKNFFPEYDYDWWEKKQLLDSLNHGHGEKRTLGKLRKLDIKRQYDRMDQLAQLLNYRKKSAEFPELYNSGEDLKRQMTKSDKGSLSQRPLTEEEEKELENLAAMDLELQKIAEKFNVNRRA